MRNLRQNQGSAEMPRIHSTASLAIIALLSSSMSSCNPTTRPPPPRVALAELEEAEKLSESLANAMQELANHISRGNGQQVALFFEDNLTATPFPAAAQPSTLVLPGVAKRHWPTDTQLQNIDSASFLESLKTFLANWGQLDTFRLSVIASDISGENAIAATLKFMITGRNLEKKRECARGRARVVAQREDSGQWRIEWIELSPFDSQVAVLDVFNEVSKAAGVAATDPTPHEPADELSNLHAGGAAAADVNQDGLIDVFAVGSQGNYLYVNQGDGTFTQEAEKVGLSAATGASAPLFVDYDNDGDSDLFLSSIDTPFLFENRQLPDGELSFVDISEKVGLEGSAIGFSISAADVNQDSYPDVYVTSWGNMESSSPAPWDGATNGLSNLFFLSQGDGTFSEVARQMGVRSPGWSMAAQFWDADLDGDADLLVANDFGAGTSLYLNAGNYFRLADDTWGISERGYGHGISLGDYDNDGDLDLHLTQTSSVEGPRMLGRYSPNAIPHKKRLSRLVSGNQLYENISTGRFKNTTPEAGPFPAGWAFGGGFLDINNDGWIDLHSPNGLFSGKSKRDTRSLFWRSVIADEVEKSGDSTIRLREERDKRYPEGFSFAGYERDMLALNQGDKSFLDISGISGADSPTDGRAAVYADFDNDGDADIFLTAEHGASHLLFRNEIGQKENFLRVVLEGRQSGRDAFGTFLRIKTALGVQSQLKSSNSGFASQNDPRLLFGLGKETAVEWVEVTWPSGVQQRFEGFKANQSVRIIEGEAVAKAISEKRFRLAGRSAE